MSVTWNDPAWRTYLVRWMRERRDDLIAMGYGTEHVDRWLAAHEGPSP